MGLDLKLYLHRLFATLNLISNCLVDLLLLFKFVLKLVWNMKYFREGVGDRKQTYLIVVPG